MIMKYVIDVSNKIELVNSVLKELNVASLETNKDFRIDDSFYQGHYVKFLLRKADCIHLELIFIDNAFQINLDRTNESFEWSNNQIQKNSEEIKGILKMLFTSRIVIEYCGSNFTKVYFFNDRTCIKTLKYVTGLYLKIGCKTREYPPIYHMLSER